MSRRTSRLATSATTALDLPAEHAIPEDTTNLDAPDQLLTPEASRSETSSNNENPLIEDKPTARRRSSRVVRASLRATEALENTPSKKDDPVPSTSQAYVDSLVKSKRSGSGLRHSIAVMESLQSVPNIPTDVTAIEDQPMAPDTPISKSSQEPQLEEPSSSVHQRSLRQRVEKALNKDVAQNSMKPISTSGSAQSLRRSARVTMLAKASDILDRANSVLGKRARNPTDKGKDGGRRASLRPRGVVTTQKEAPITVPAEPVSKKRRVSESDLLKPKSKAPSSEEPTPLPVFKSKPKMWLTHGLYSGQEPSDSPPKQRKSKNSENNKPDVKLRRCLPMPMFAGARLISNGRDYVLPFDIFSPLPPGQPKPDEWRKTNKNVFVGDAASEWKANKKLELSTCMCDEETGCDENCQNRYMFYECDAGNCRLGPECGNRNFSELKVRTKAGGKYNIGVEVIKTVDRGYGVRSNRTFEPNQIIVEYTGEIITQFECERRMKSVYKNNDCYYLMYFDQNMIIDATRGSIARFVNHSCEPNCRMEKWTVAGKPRMALFAGDRGIMTGEELSYDYNFDPYSNKNVQQCRCGAPNCRGILGPRPKDKDQRAKADGASRIQTSTKGAGTKRKRTATGSNTKTQAKKRKLLTPKSIKAGVRKAVNKVSASASRGKAGTTKKPPAVSTKRGEPKPSPKTKKSIKLPTVKATSRVKASVQRKAGSAQVAPSNKTAQLKRPSPETKKKILHEAVKGSRSATKSKSPASRSSTQGQKQKPETKTPGKPRGKDVSNARGKTKVSLPKANRAMTKSPNKSASKGKGLSSSLKKVAQRVVRTTGSKPK